MNNSGATLAAIARMVAERALEQHVSLASAESCTGGLIAHLLTSVPGVSAIYPGSIIAYANTAKQDLLAVPLHVLETYGAVSAMVALLMARGAQHCLHADLAVATTGIAGPGGGSVAKPVGLVYIAVRHGVEERCARFRFDGDRAEIIAAATGEALRMVGATLSTVTG